MPYTGFTEDIEMVATLPWYNTMDLLRFISTAERKDLSVITNRKEVVDMFNSIGKFIFSEEERFPSVGKFVPEEGMMEGFSISIRSITDVRDRNANAKAQTGASSATLETQANVAIYSFRNKLSEMRGWIRSQKPGYTRLSFEGTSGLAWTD
jgi:hypothetical protein